jgi:hypothetical protein
MTGQNHYFEPDGLSFRQATGQAAAQVDDQVPNQITDVQV